MSLSHKINRYSSLIKDFNNWPSFLFYKTGKKSSFVFKMRNGFKIEVKRKMLPPFKESFFDKVYLKHFPQNSLPNHPTIVDIGANVGFFSLAMFSQYPKARIIAFEPMPFNFNQLKDYQNTFSKFNWEIENKAIAANNKGLTLFSSTIDGFSTMAGVFSSDQKAEKIEVGTLTLKEVMEGKGIETIDLLKLDCEGSEYSILYNLEAHLFDRIKLMSIETHPGEEGDENHEGMIRFLEEKGYLLKEQVNSDGTGYVWAWK